MLRLFAIIALALSFIFSGTAAIAQTAAQLDDISAAVLNANTDDLVTALEAVPTDAELPSGFTVPADGVADNAEVVDAFSGALGDLGDGTVSVVHGINTDPSIVEGTLSAAMITYLVVEDEITDDDLVNFADGLESGFQPDPATGVTDGAVDEIELFDSNAIVATLQMEQLGAFVTVQMMAIPVGNVMVVSTIVVANTAVTDPQDIMPLSENLTIASVMYLGDVVDGL